MTNEAAVATENDQNPSDLDDPGRVLIPMGMWAKAEHIVAKANRRLARAGVSDTAFSLTRGETEIRTVTEEDGSEVQVEVIVAHLNRPTIKAEGWEFVAAAEYSPTLDAVMMHTNPTAENVETLPIPETMFCDHCDTNRRRNKVYLVRHEQTGEIKTVGSSCVAPFLGLGVAALWWLGLDVSTEIDEASAPGFRSARCCNRDEALNLAWILSKGGMHYANSKSAKSTRGAVSDVLWPPREPYSKVIAAAQERRAAQEKFDQSIVDALIAAVDTLDEESSYGANLRHIVASEWVPDRYLGYLVSLVSVYRRILDGTARADAKAKKAAATPAEIYAAVGTVVTDVPVLVEKVSGHVNAYNREVKLLVMRAETGHLLKCWTSSAAASEVETGDRLLITRARVKGLDEFEGQVNTVVNYLKFTPQKGSDT